MSLLYGRADNTGQEFEDEALVAHSVSPEELSSDVSRICKVDRDDGTDGTRAATQQADRSSFLRRRYWHPTLPAYPALLMWCFTVMRRSCQTGSATVLHDQDLPLQDQAIRKCQVLCALSSDKPKVKTQPLKYELPYEIEQSPG